MFQAVNRRESKSLANAATNGNPCDDSMPVILGTSELQASNLLSTLKYHDDTPAALRYRQGYHMNPTLVLRP
jgi:hypothetical protein